MAVVPSLLGLPFFVFGQKVFGNGDMGAVFGWGVGIVVMIVSCVAIISILRETAICSKAEIVSDCARLLAAKEGIRLNREGKNWTRDQIELRVREIISEQAGIKLGQIKLEHHLFKDLRLG